jgi:hypothetical protein
VKNNRPSNDQVTALAASAEGLVAGWAASVREGREETLILGVTDGNKVRLTWAGPKETILRLAKKISRDARQEFGTGEGPVSGEATTGGGPKK